MKHASDPNAASHRYLASRLVRSRLGSRRKRVPALAAVQLELRRGFVHGGLLLGCAIRKLEMIATVGNVRLKFTPSVDWRSTLAATCFMAPGEWNGNDNDRAFLMVGVPTYLLCV